jgi:SOS-response transcriptional repressor LexA
MDTPGDRLRQLREDRGWSVRELAKRTEGAITYSYVSHLERGVAAWAKVSLTVLRGFARAFNMSIEDFVDFVDGRSEVSAVAETLVQGRRVPVYDLVSAGDGLDGGVVIDYAEVPANWAGEYVAYEIEGDSMSPSVQPGSVVIVRRTPDVRPGQLVVAYVPEHGMVLKRYAHNEPDGLMVLTSDNPTAPPIFTRELAPVGVVVEVRTKTA